MPPLPIAEEQDLLTQELNGLVEPEARVPKLVGVVEKFDASEIRKQEQPQPLADALDVNFKPPSVAKPAPSPRAKAADAVHSVAAGGQGYRVVVAGDYYAKADNGGHKLVEYAIPFNLPALVNHKGEAALGMILRASDPENSLLFRALKKKDPNFKAVHTHWVKSTMPLNGAPEPTSLQYMGMDALAAFARQRELGINPAQYWDVEHLRADVIHLVTNVVDNADARTGAQLSDQIKDGKGLGVKVSPLEFVKKRHQDRMDAKALLDMNDGLGD